MPVRFLKDEQATHAKQYAISHLQKEPTLTDQPVCSYCYRKVLHFMSKPNAPVDIFYEKQNVVDKCTNILHKYQNYVSDQSLSNVIIFACSEFLNDRPVLLQDLVDLYNDCDTCTQAITAMQLLKKLTNIFGDIISTLSSSQYPRLGTLLKLIGNEDALSCLKLLSDLRIYRHFKKEEFDVIQNCEQTESSNSVNEKVKCLKESSKLLHDDLLTLVNAFKKRQQDKDALKHFDAKGCISSISPNLWNFFQLLHQKKRLAKTCFFFQKQTISLQILMTFHFGNYLQYVC